MLVNITQGFDPLFSRILDAVGQGGANIELQDGIYLSPSFSFGHQILEKHEEFPELDDNYAYSPYGVCDNLEQVLEHYRQWLDLPDRKFCISFTCVTKAEQPETYGWRWHKWGTYIGTKEPKHEYLYEEDDSIDHVYCYHIYEIL